MPPKPTCRPANAIVVLSFLVVAGCVVPPDSTLYDASEFTEFGFEVVPFDTAQAPCSGVCGASITLVQDDEYVANLLLVSDGGETLEAEHSLTEEQALEMLELFASLTIDPYSGPFCLPPIAGGYTADYILRWDDVEMTLSECGQPRIAPTSLREIEAFLGTLAADE